MSCSVEQRQHVVAHVGVGGGHLEVEHLLVAPGLGQGAAPAQDPVGVLPGEVGILVDHLGLDPQAEVESQGPDPLDQWRQALGPDRRVDRPVAEPRPVVAAAAEPAVVEDEPLGADLGRCSGQGLEPLEVVVEVGGLPRVDHDRALRARARGVPAGPGVQARRGLVEAGVAVTAHQPGACVGLALGEHDLPGSEQLTAAQQALPLGGPLGVRRVVAAPGEVGGPHLAVPEAEPREACRHQQVGVVAGAAVAGVAQVGPDEPGATLRSAFAAPASGEVEELGGAGRDRQGAPDRAEVQGAGPGVGHGRAQADDSLAGELEVDPDAPAGLGVDGSELHHGIRTGVVAGERPVPQLGQGGCRRAAHPVPLERRQPGEAAAGLAQQAPAPRVVECRVWDGRHGRLDDALEDSAALGAQSSAPVTDERHS